jgi:hypothetical protein
MVDFLLAVGFLCVGACLYRLGFIDGKEMGRIEERYPFNKDTE